MENRHATMINNLRLVDNCFYKPDNALANSRRLLDPVTEGILEKYADLTLDQWESQGLIVLPEPGITKKHDDYAHRDNVIFDLGRDEAIDSAWINTHNCMGVVKLNPPSNEGSIQIEIGSRFDDKDVQRPYFLTYLLCRVFGGSVVDVVTIGKDSLWDLLLAFVFRRRLIAATAVGLFKQYRTLQWNDARIRGKINVDKHLRQNIPFQGKIAYSTHERIYDNPTTHLIRHAMEKISRKWPKLLEERNRLFEIRHQLEQNTPTWQPHGVAACVRRKENRFPIKHHYCPV